MIKKNSKNTAKAISPKSLFPASQRDAMKKRPASTRANVHASNAPTTTRLAL
jgi:hypothetical protein